MFARLNKPRTSGTIIIIYLNQAMRPIPIHTQTVKKKTISSYTANTLSTLKFAEQAAMPLVLFNQVRKRTALELYTTVLKLGRPRLNKI